MKTYFSKLHYCKNPGVLDKAALTLLMPATLGYALIASLRNLLYDTGLMRSVKLPEKVISIGNLTTGGTGKTPVTSAIANYLIGSGKKVAVISRGYGGKLSCDDTNIISDGEKTFYTADMAGDEPFWITQNAPGTVVITGKDRVKSGKLAIKNFGCDVLLLDDGFQHRRVRRDLDILLVDSEKEFGNGFLLPAGALRENLCGTKRADKVVIVEKTPCENTEKLQKMFGEKYVKDTCICRFTGGDVYNILTGEVVDKIKTAVAFTGIAQPESFFNLLEQKGIELKAKKVFPDHHLYSPEDIEEILKDVQGTDAVIATEKDCVKIQQILKQVQDDNVKETQTPVCALKLETSLDIGKLIDADTCN